MTEQSIINKTICKVAYKTDSTMRDIVFNPRSKIMLFFGLSFIFFPIYEIFYHQFNFNSLNATISIFSLFIGTVIILSFIFNKITMFELFIKNKITRNLSITVMSILLIIMYSLIYFQHGIIYVIKISGLTLILGIVATLFAYGLQYVLSKCPKFNNKKDV